MTKAFASQGDMTEKTISFTEVGEGLWAFTAEGDPNSGVIIGDESVMIVEAQATPRLANKVIECVRSVTDKPISHVVLTHYHAVRVLGASAFFFFLMIRPPPRSTPYPTRFPYTTLFRSPSPSSHRYSVIVPSGSREALPSK